MRLLGAVLFLTALSFAACSPLGSEDPKLRLEDTFKDDFAGDCDWPEGEWEEASFGCSEGAYDLTLKRKGPFHVAAAFEPSASEVAIAADVSVVSGKGRAEGASIGLACMVDESNGYIFIVDTSTSGWQIDRINDGSFSVLSGLRTSEHLVALPEEFRLRAQCGSGEYGLDFIANGHGLGTANDDEGFEGPFTGVAFWTNTFPGIVRFDDVEIERLAD